VAVVGASADKTEFSNKAIQVHRHAGYDVYPVNPKGETIEGLKCYKSVLDIPVELDRISLYLPPTVGEVANALARAKVNLPAIDTSGGFEYNIVRIVTDKVAKARAILRQSGLDVGETKALGIPAKDQPGALGDTKVNIDYLYATAGSAQFAAVACGPCL
jgi:hypothetical protein